MWVSVWKCSCLCAFLLFFWQNTDIGGNNINVDLIHENYHVPEEIMCNISLGSKSSHFTSFILKMCIFYQTGFLNSLYSIVVEIGLFLGKPTHSEFWRLSVPTKFYNFIVVHIVLNHETKFHIV